MASTNKTTNYQLSQYIGSDKPTYLGDYNSDMSKIDAQMKTNADNIATAISGVESATSTANSAVSTATQANTTAQSASSTATSASTTASNAQSTANSALSTATSAQSKANEVETNLNSFEQKLNFTHFDNITNITASTGNIDVNNLKIASNEDGDVAKIYGWVRVSGRTAGNMTLSFSSRLRPSSNLTITGVAFGYIQSNSTSDPIISITEPSIAISTNGDIVVTSPYGVQAPKIESFRFMACLLFLKDFGDTPTPTPNE